MTSQNQGEEWRAFFPPNVMSAEAMHKNVHAFWTAQTEVLNGLKAFTDGWFQRRQIGAQAAEEFCARMCAAKNPLDWIREYQVWSLGAFQRMMADGLALQQGIKKISDEVGPSIVPSPAKETGAETRSREPAQA